MEILILACWEAPIHNLRQLKAQLLCILYGGSEGKKSTCNVGNPGWIPGSGRSPGEVNGYPLQYSCLENSMDRGTWQATFHGAIKSQT